MQRQRPVADPEQADRRIGAQVKRPQSPASAQQHAQDEGRYKQRMEDELVQAAGEKADAQRSRMAEAPAPQEEP